MGNRGHLFVVQADLTRLAADAFLIPCDEQLNVSGTWRPFIDGGPAQPADRWFKPADVQLENGLAVLPDPTPEKPQRPDEVVGLRVLVDTVGPHSINDMVERALDAVHVAADKASKHSGRALPLVALPILGVGQGRFPGQRAEVVRLLVSRLHDFVADHPIDVALVLRRTSDFAAVQWARQLVESEGQDAWPELAELRPLADELGDKAGRGELSLFVGAGASKAVGFPDWQELLEELDTHKRLDFSGNPNYPQLAEQLDVPDLNDRIASRFSTRKHAISHGLLAGLRAQAQVTTNYDPCLENAGLATYGVGGQRVLARQLARGGTPWLLKLHGDLAKPDTIVLTETQYRQLEGDKKALRGVVQALMLTSHLLFVGFGFADDDFLAMSEAVDHIRALADDTERGPVGTAIELRDSSADPDRRRFAELDYRAMSPADGSIGEAARRLEIFLDRVAWKCQVAGAGRAAFLLDADYRGGADPRDEALIHALTRLSKARAEWGTSAGSQDVLHLLQRLGLR